MFKKIVEEATGSTAATPVSPAARRTGPALAAGSGLIWIDPTQREGGRRSELTIVGSVSGDAEIAVNSRIQGDVSVTRLTLDEGGVIEGDVTAEQVEIRGRVVGNIKAAVVRLCANAVVEGDITAGKLSIDMGADFQGMCRRLPQAAQAAAPSPAPQTYAPAQAPLAAHSAAPAMAAIDPALAMALADAAAESRSPEALPN